MPDDTRTFPSPSVVLVGYQRQLAIFRWRTQPRFVGFAESGGWEKSILERSKMFACFSPVSPRSLSEPPLMSTRPSSRPECPEQNSSVIWFGTGRLLKVVSRLPDIQSRALAAAPQ